MIVDQFINKKIDQLNVYVTAVIDQSLYYIELDQFVVDTMSEWTLLEITDESPNNARERVFWHLIHEISLYGAQAIEHNLYFKSEISACLDFFSGTGSYPIDCIGWRPIA
jgi:hypothetical protein|tara:strand:+ start:121 stop:450 length:330 start_codon:yes stop_codon:yes gene_type:complete